MTQGTATPWRNPQSMTLADTASVDAFGRLRASNIVGLFDAQFTYDLQPLIYDQITALSGAAINHDATNRCATIEFNATPTGGQAIMQSFEHIRYQPGKSQLIFISFNFKEHAAQCQKFVGYSDGTNGIEVQSDGSKFFIALLSGTDVGNQSISQESWNLDPLDGTGPSGYTLDVAQTQLAVIDFQALYVGRVRVGFDIDGKIVYAHEFLCANLLANGWIQSANLPIRAGMECTTTSTTSMDFICCSVSVEGSNDRSPAYTFSIANTVSAGAGTPTYMFGLRPKALFNGIENRSKLVLDSLNLAVTGTDSVYWELGIGQGLTGGAWADVNSTYSASSYDTASGLSGTPDIVIASGYVTASNQARNGLSQQIASRYPLTLDAGGAPRELGTVVLIVQSLGAASDVWAALNFREER